MDIDDAAVEAKIEDLKAIVHKWAIQHDLWHDASFTTWEQHFQLEPEENPCVLVMCFEGPLYSIFSGSDPEGL